MKTYKPTEHLKLNIKTVESLFDIDMEMDYLVYEKKEVDAIIHEFNIICNSFHNILTPEQIRIVFKDVRRLNSLKKNKIYVSGKTK